MEEYINQDTTDDFSEYCHAVAAAKPLVGVLICYQLSPAIRPSALGWSAAAVPVRIPRRGRGRRPHASARATCAGGCVRRFLRRTRGAGVARGRAGPGSIHACAWTPPWRSASLLSINAPRRQERPLSLAARVHCLLHTG